MSKKKGLGPRTSDLGQSQTPASESGSAAGRSPKPEARGPDWWDASALWLRDHGALWALALITFGVALIHIHVFAGEVAGDDLTFHFAESRRLADCLRVLDFDFWNPSANAGYASAYYYQVLPQLASALPTAIFGHHLFWFQVSVWLPHVAAPVAAYRGMRLLGASPWQAVLAAFAVAFTNGESKWGAGNAGTFQVGLYTQTWALAAFPIALGHGARWIADKKGLAPAVAWGAFTGLCHPFIVIVLGLGLAISVIARLVPALDRLTWTSVVGRALVMLGLGLLWVVPRSWFAIVPPLAIQIPAILLIACGLALPIAIHTPGARWIFPDMRRFRDEMVRTLILGALMILAWAPVWVPLLADMGGFGGFPHRVGGEEGPGFYELGHWYRIGALLDWGGHMRFAAFTWALPVVILFCRDRMMRWLWPPALFFAALLGLGPHLGKIGDDLFPAVRALGTMQVALALGIGAGAMILGQKLWNLPWQRWFGGTRPPAAKPGKDQPPGEEDAIQYGVRTAIAAAAAALVVLIVIPGSRALAERVRVLAWNPNLHRDELLAISEKLATLPPGRKQGGPGAENHWANLLPYVYDRVPAMLQMGGGGLQASPNYDFLWTSHEYVKTAWVYDAPYVLFAKNEEKKVPAGEVVAQTEHYEVRKFPSPGLVSPVQVIAMLPPGYHNRDPGHEMALEWLTGRPSMETRRWLDRFGIQLGGDEPMRDQVLAYDGSGPPGPPPAGKLLRAWHQDSPGSSADIVAEVQVDAPSTFVIRESWHPRWHAYIDGDEVRVRRVTPDFPAVDVAAGKHTIELRFERPWWVLLSWLAWPGVPLGAWLVMRRRQRRGSRTAEPAEPSTEPAEPSAEPAEPAGPAGA